MKKLVNQLKARYNEQEGILLNLEAMKAEAQESLNASEAAFAETTASMLALQSEITDQITKEVQKTFPFFCNRVQGLKPLPETLSELEDQLTDFTDHNAVLVVTDSFGNATKLIRRIDWRDADDTFNTLYDSWENYSELKNQGTHYFTINT